MKYQSIYSLNSSHGTGYVCDTLVLDIWLIYHICDWIWKELVSTHTTVRHTFHHQRIALNISGGYWSWMLPRLLFTVAFFWDWLDVHMCLNDHLKASFPFDKQTAGFNSSYNQLMTVAMDCASLCGSYVKVKMVPIDAIWLSLVLT